MTKSFIHINSRSAVPKYRQVINKVIEAIEQNKLKVGDKLPSIKQICSDSSVKRDTAMFAFNELRARGIISSHQGKGYYITSTDVSLQEKYFLLFDNLDNFAVSVYNHLTHLLPQKSGADIFFHQNDAARINEFLSENNGNYSHYIFLFSGLENYCQQLSRFNGSRMCLIGLPEAEMSCQYLYHAYGRDMYESLKSLKKQIKKYCRLVYICRNGHDKPGRMDGFLRYCAEENFEYLICHDPDHFRPALYEAYVIPEDGELLSMLGKVRKNDFIMGENIGILAFGDSSLKEYAGGGLTAIATDYEDMCHRLIEITHGKKRGHPRIKPRVILRNSL